MKRVKKFLFWILILLTTIVVGSFTASYLLRDKIVNYVTTEINKQLLVEINVSKIDFTFWKEFPSAALEFSNVLAHDPSSQNPLNDTLFQFEKVYLAFNIDDIYNEIYTLRSITLKNGSSSLYTDKKNRSNYIFWKTTSDTTSSSKFSVALDKVTLENIRLNWFHENRKENIKLNVKKVIAKGNFTDKEHSTALYGSVKVKKLQFDNNQFLPNEDLKLDIGFEVNDKNFQISRGYLTLREHYKFDVKGKFKEDEYSLSINGNNLDVNAIRELIPKKHLTSIQDYKGKGKLNLNLAIEKPKKSQRQKITADFVVKGGTLVHQKTNYKIENLNFSGHYSNGNKMSPWTSEINIKDFSAQFKSGKIEGNFYAFNFKRPKIKLNLDANYDLNDFLTFFPSDTIESAKGKVAIQATFEGRLQQADTILPKDIINSKVSGNLKLNDVSFALKRDDLTYNDFNTDLTLINNSVKINSFEGKVSDSDIRLKGTLSNFLPWMFFDNETLKINANLQSKHINLNQVLSGENSSKKEDDSYQLHLPQRVITSINFNIENLILEKLDANQLRGKISSDKNTLKLNDIYLESLDGIVKGKLHLTERPQGNFILKSKGTLRNIDIHQLFVVFEDFGQSSIQSRHLKGKLNSNYTLTARLKSNLHVDTKSINIRSDLKVEDGELINYEPLTEVTKDFNENKILRLFIKLDDFNQRLKHIKFKTLQNKFSIKDETLFIPYMKIESSALDINLAGTHTFDNHIDYLLDFNLKQVLTRKEKIKDTEYGYIKDDGTGNKMVFLKITGSVDTPKISFNRKASKSYSKELINKEIQTTKKILKEEFNLNGHKNKRNEEPTQEADFELDLEDFHKEDKKETSKTISTKNDTTDSSKGLKKILKKVRNSKKEEKSKFEEWEFEDDDY